MTISKRKEKQRKQGFKYRSRLTQRELLKKSMEIKSNLFEIEEFEKAEVIMFYVAFRNEVRTEFMIKSALELGKRVIVPITDVENKKLYLSELKDYDDELTEGSYGILEPKEEFIRTVEPSDLDLVVLPGLAFDSSGNRLGYGGGYYDRLLSQIPTVDKMAICFDVQIMDEVITNSKDIAVDKIITEKRDIICCS